jgi:hypothetical protein
MTQIEKIDYGRIDHTTILTIFGDEMTYNELMKSKNIDGETHLEVEWNQNSETQLVRVWFNSVVVMDKKYSINHSCDMFYHLNQLQIELEVCCELCNEGCCENKRRWWLDVVDDYNKVLYCNWCFDKMVERNNTEYPYILVDEY